jgi:hypothetical protein
MRILLVIDGHQWLVGDCENSLQVFSRRMLVRIVNLVPAQLSLTLDYKVEE